MREAMLERRLRPPRFDVRDGYFVVTLLGEDQAWHNVRVEPGLLSGLEPIQRQIVQHLLQGGIDVLRYFRSWKAVEER